MALVVIGGTAAGLSAAARARRIDPRLEIIVLEKGSVISLGACGLPYFVEGRIKQAEDLAVFTPERFSKERSIDVRTGTRVLSIAHPRREVVLENGGRVGYEKLVIATGARAGSLGIAGDGQPHVFRLQTLDDAVRMRGFLRDRKPRSAVVIGTGYIGIEAADALRRSGLGVTILERSAHTMLCAGDSFTGDLRKQLERHRVELRTGVNVTSIEPDSVAGVPCDMVVVAAGVRPNVELAGDAGIQLGRTGAIRTDERMETNVRGIYAAGDCAEVMHLVTGRPVWVPLGTTANKCGRVAGANAAGRRERFPGIVGTSIVNVFGVGFATTGVAAADARAQGFTPVSARIEALSRPKYYQGSRTVVELVADRATGRLIGGYVIGEDGVAGRINVIAAALHAKMKVDEFEQLDLAYAPPFAPAWDPVLIAAQQLVKEIQ